MKFYYSDEDDEKQVIQGRSGGTIRPGRLGGQERSLKGCSKACRVDLRDANLQEHESRILAHQRRVQKEMDALGLKKLSGVTICSICGVETFCYTKRRLKTGWVETSGGTWLCPKCSALCG